MRSTMEAESIISRRERKESWGGGGSVEIFTEYFHTLGGQFARSYFFLPCMFSKALHYVFISFTFIINYNCLHITLPHTGGITKQTHPYFREHRTEDEKTKVTGQ